MLITEQISSSSVSPESIIIDDKSEIQPRTELDERGKTENSRRKVHSDSENVARWPSNHTPSPSATNIPLARHAAHDEPGSSTMSADGKCTLCSKRDRVWLTGWCCAWHAAVITLDEEESAPRGAGDVAERMPSPSATHFPLVRDAAYDEPGSSTMSADGVYTLCSNQDRVWLTPQLDGLVLCVACCSDHPGRGRIRSTRSW